jgi:hypothetical protein
MLIKRSVQTTTISGIQPIFAGFQLSRRPHSGRPDARIPDGRNPDARIPDARIPDARIPDAYSRDAPEPSAASRIRSAFSTSLAGRVARYSDTRSEAA